MTIKSEPLLKVVSPQKGTRVTNYFPEFLCLLCLFVATPLSIVGLWRQSIKSALLLDRTIDERICTTFVCSRVLSANNEPGWGSETKSFIRFPRRGHTRLCLIASRRL